MKITFSGNKKMSKRLNQRINNLAGKKRVLKKIADEEVNQAQKRITTTKRSPLGHPWKAWSYATMRARMSQGTAGSGLLYNSGRLARSFKATVTDTMVKITNIAPYAGHLQEGTKNMPPRPFLGWSRKAKARMKKIFIKQLRK